MANNVFPQKKNIKDFLEVTAGKKNQTILKALFKSEYKGKKSNINLLEKVKCKHFYEPLYDGNGMTSFLK